MKETLENKASQAGFSLLELIVSALLLAVVTGSAVHLLNQTQASFRSQIELSQQTRQLQAALDQIVRYFRQAGADPFEATGASPIEIISTTHIRLNSDVTGEFGSVTSDPKEATGDPDGSLDSIYEQVEIRHDSQQDRVYIDIGYGEETLAEEVTNLAFTFYDNNGVVTTDPAEIVRVQIRISGSADYYTPNLGNRIASITLEVNAFLRNRMAQVLL